MIKKNTKVIFEDGESKKSEDIDCFMDGADQRVDITYVLRKKS